MPYIEPLKRAKYDLWMDTANGVPIETKGDLEYLVCSLMDKFMETREFRYSDLHDCCKAVEHAAHEFERRFLDPREDTAREKNGDVFPKMIRRFGL